MKHPLRICMVNWRCPRHPGAGGAERSSTELLGRLANKGHHITWFSANTPGAPLKEYVEGIHYIRQGNAITVRFWFFFWSLAQQHTFDIFIEQVNTLPFLGIYYLRKPVVAYVHQVAKELWFYQYPFPLAILGYLLEHLLLFALRGTKAIVVSKSTRASLIEFGHCATQWIVPNGLPSGLIAHQQSFIPQSDQIKLIVVSRLVRHKRIDHIVRAMSLLTKQNINARLTIVGNTTTSESKRLMRLVVSLKLSNVIEFAGQVTDERLNELYRAAHMVISTSVREGWGLTINEANICGVPSVVYPAPGLIDSTIHGCNGIICNETTPSSLVEGVQLLLANYNAILYNLKHYWPATISTWDQSADTLEQILTDLCPDSTLSQLQ